jgi:hypothetical protein
MEQWVFVEYRDFYDVPRMILARCDLGTFLFYSRFEEVAGEYSDHYEVYSMAPLSSDDVSGSWIGIEARALKRLDKLSVSDFPFDVALRRFLYYDPIYPLLQRDGYLLGGPV